MSDRGAQHPRPRRRRGSWETSDQSPRGPRPPLSRSAITPRQTGSSGECPHAAASDVRVIRQGARLFSRRRSATGTSGVVRATGLRGQVGSVSPDALDSTIVTPSRSKTSGRIALNGRGPVRRPFEIGGRAARAGGAAAALVADGAPPRSVRASAAGSAWGIQSTAARRSRETCSNDVSCSI